ncbi:MAG: hypothetical protein GY796_35070 [Chloroflexi bacterium]|nr:hypothetical protein [Chloroflexota bacterium]
MTLSSHHLTPMLTPAIIDKQSPFLGEECALCKDPFAPGEEVVICPEDGSCHHAHCWVANGHQCAAFGCAGHGRLSTESPHPSSPQRTVVTRPSSSFGYGQTCLLLAIAIAIIFFSIGCFGLWAIADYLMLNVWDMPYRPPFSGMILLLTG